LKRREPSRASPTLVKGYELNVIAAVVIGRRPVDRRQGTVVGTIIVR